MMREASNELKVRFSDEDMAWMRERVRLTGQNIYDLVRCCVAEIRQNVRALEATNESPPFRGRPAPSGKTDIETMNGQMAELRGMVSHLSEAMQTAFAGATPARPYNPAMVDGQEPVEEFDYDQPPPVEEVDIPADDDGGVASQEVRHILQSPVPQPSAVRRFGAAKSPLGQPMPGSITGPAGVNSRVGKGFQLGDPRGNLIRENFSHLGFEGGGARAR